MKIATFNVNGITSRLPKLLEWLAQEAPDVVCLQELKTLDKGFPAAEIRKAGYGADPTNPPAGLEAGAASGSEDAGTESDEAPSGRVQGG